MVGKLLKAILSLMLLAQNSMAQQSELIYHCSLQNYSVEKKIRKPEEKESLILKFERSSKGVLIFGESENILIFATTTELDGVSVIKDKSTHEAISINFRLDDIEIDFSFNTKNGVLRSIGKKIGSNKIIETIGVCKYQSHTPSRI